MDTNMNTTVTITVKKHKAHSLLRALVLANKHAHRQATRARRNAASTVAGWAMEGADYAELHALIKQFIKEAK